MALTHHFSRTEYETRNADMQTLRTQVATALATLQAQIDDTNVTNAEAVTYIKQQAQIDKALIKAVASLLR